MNYFIYIAATLVALGCSLAAFGLGFNPQYHSPQINIITLMTHFLLGFIGFAALKTSIMYELSIPTTATLYSLAILLFLWVGFGFQDVVQFDHYPEKRYIGLFFAPFISFPIALILSYLHHFRND